MLKSFFQARPTKKTIKINKRRNSGLLFFSPSPFRVLVFSLGTGLFLTALAYLAFLLWPLGQAFLNYKFGPPDNFKLPLPPPITASQEVINYNDFFIDIPKIKATARVFPNTPADDKAAYSEVLTKGVAHAAGSYFPGQGKTIFLFAHSTNSSFNAVRYNAVFMLINELNNGDTINIFFNGKYYIYQVFDKKIVPSNRTDFISFQADTETLILQTCWPPGTTWNRLLVFARRE
jgi:LPXTG-site transpeptidase (sortase) family protein